MILIPFPSVKNNQRFNAKYVAGKNAALYVEEHETNDTKLMEIISHLIDDPEARKTLSMNARGIKFVNGAKILKAVLLSLK